VEHRDARRLAEPIEPDVDEGRDADEPRGVTVDVSPCITSRLTWCTSTPASVAARTRT
jgi:hypothetical protein